ncbi:hypothetical protein KP509_04G073200 [Ceratopteris richardii]|uniref:Profilin n=1 Tax=Ceratopteris richardii TaxID=49495 RepID=A0A8T2UY31_CERRI|nr:hypothetical protein KP509_04G073200 [Ceratopteris richardii]
MSWQTYVDDHLLCLLPSGNTLTSAAIVGLDGSVWASSEKFPAISAKEIDDIIKAFEDSSTIAQKGLFIGGTKYFVVQGEEGVVIRGKKGPGGVTIKKTGFSLIFGIYDEPVAPPECNTIVEKLGDYLIEQGY